MSTIIDLNEFFDQPSDLHILEHPSDLDIEDAILENKSNTNENNESVESIDLSLVDFMQFFDLV